MCTCCYLVRRWDATACGAVARKVRLSAGEGHIDEADDHKRVHSSKAIVHLSEMRKARTHCVIGLHERGTWARQLVLRRVHLSEVRVHLSETRMARLPLHAKNVVRWTRYSDALFCGHFGRAMWCACPRRAPHISQADEDVLIMFSLRNSILVTTQMFFYYRMFRNTLLFPTKQCYHMILLIGDSISRLKNCGMISPVIYHIHILCTTNSPTDI